MNFRFQIPNSKFSASLRLCGLILLLASISLSQNDLQKIPDGGFIEKWLFSNEFPAEIDAGMWENFNRFNIENLPQKDWLKPFGKPQVGRQLAVAVGSQQSSSTSNNQNNGQPLPEVGAASTTKIFPDAKEITWAQFTEKDAVIAFNLFHEGKSIGTAYAASYINSSNEEVKFIETDGFLRLDLAQWRENLRWIFADLEKSCGRKF